jgi:hypothetical protein
MCELPLAVAEEAEIRLGAVNAAVARFAAEGIIGVMLIGTDKFSEKCKQHRHINSFICSCLCYIMLHTD